MVTTNINNSIEADLSPELEAKIAKRYDLPNMFAVEDKDHDSPHQPHISEVQSLIKIHPLSEQEIPEALLKRYAVKDNVYYSKDYAKGSVFEDKGKSIYAKSSDPDDVRAMISLAQSKHWSKIKIKGSTEFKREVWLAANLQGIEVEGYSPSPQDIALLNDAKQKVKNSIEFADPALTSDTVSIANAKSNPSTSSHSPVYTKSATLHADKQSILVAHGAAKFLHDQKNTDSYFVTTRDESGQEKTVWGIDLERAINQSGVKVGDQIDMKFEGQKPVTITVPKYGSDGNVIGFEDKHTYRNSWDVQSPTAAEVAIVAVAKAKGAGEKTQALMKQKASIAINQLKKMGVNIPSPMVYDNKAPANNDRSILPSAKPAILKKFGQPQITPKR